MLRSDIDTGWHDSLEAIIMTIYYDRNFKKRMDLYCLRMNSTCSACLNRNVSFDLKILV